MSNIIGYAESRNRDFANGAPVTSPAGAKYRMQVMPSTARDPGFGIIPARNDSPEEYNRVGEAYWRKLRDKYGNLPQMFGAYNAGPGRIDDLVAKYGPNWLRYAPRETQDYVARNMRVVKGN